MTEIYVDADACPVKDEVIRVAERHGLPVVMVSNRGMRAGQHPLVRQVVVADGMDAADDWIVDHAGASDVAVTADIRLAARCIDKGCRVLSPTGKPFTETGIGTAVAMRDLMQHLRDTGEITGGPRGFSRQDRSRFLSALETMVQAALRGR